MSQVPEIVAAQMLPAHQFLVRAGTEVRGLVKGEIANLVDTVFQAVSEKDQPDGYAGLDGDGHLVGPILLTDYADNTAAGARDEGEIFTVDGELRIGDGATNGGNPTGSDNTPIGYDLQAGNLSLAMDFTKSGLYAFFMAGSGRTLTVTNANDMPIGFKFNAHLYVDTGPQTMTITGGAMNLVLSGLATGIHYIEVSRILDDGDNDYNWQVTNNYAGPLF